MNVSQATLSLDALIPTLELAIGPVILISGVGLVLLCMTNRIARVIDRARLVAAEREGCADDECDDCYSQLGILCRRAKILRASIAMASFSVLLVAVLVILLFCGALLRLEIAGLIVSLFVACMCSLIGALVCFIRDVNLSLQALWLEISHVGRGRSHSGRTKVACAVRPVARPSVQLSG
jgi:hypothetical protein